MDQRRLPSAVHIRRLVLGQRPHVLHGELSLLVGQAGQGRKPGKSHTGEEPSIVHWVLVSKERKPKAQNCQHTPRGQPALIITLFSKQSSGPETGLPKWSSLRPHFQHCFWCFTEKSPGEPLTWRWSEWASEHLSRDGTSPWDVPHPGF